MSPLRLRRRLVRCVRERGLRCCRRGGEWPGRHAQVGVQNDSRNPHGFAWHAGTESPVDSGRRAFKRERGVKVSKHVPVWSTLALTGI